MYKRLYLYYLMENFDFDDTFNIWYHHDKDNWKVSGFKNILSINNTKTFWQLFNNSNILLNSNKHIFIMKNDVVPIWEDKNNINGGCWSFKIVSEQIEKLFELLMTNFVSNNLLKDYSNDDILGISFCKKKNNFFVIKVWNKFSKLNSIGNLNDDIIDFTSNEIIYISHLVNT